VPGDLGQSATVPGDLPVDGRHHRRPGYPAPGGQHGAHVGMVMDDVNLAGQRLVGGQHVRCLFEPVTHRLSRRGEQPLPRHRAGGRADGEQHDVVAERGQAAREVVDDLLGTAVAGRRDRDPRRGDESDSHGKAPHVDGEDCWPAGAGGATAVAVLGGTR
jgi:hypothetical protein